MSLLDAPVNRAAVERALFPGRCFYNFKPSNTRHLRLGLAKVRAGTGRLRIACLGDSTTAGTGANTGTSGQVGAYPFAYPDQLAAILNKRLANSFNGAVWGQTNTAVVAYGTYDTRLTLGSGWTTGNDGIGGAMFTNSTTTNALAFVPKDAAQSNLTFDTINVYYLRNSGHATWTVDVDGGSALATTNANGTASVQKLSVTCASGAHTINIKRTGTGGALFIIGIVAYNSAVPAIQVWNWGYHGSTSTSWNVSSHVWDAVNSIPVVAPEMLLYGIGINDQPTTDTATFKTNVQAILTAQLAVGDCAIVVPDPVNPLANTQADQDRIRQALLDLAVTNDLPVIDRTLHLESYAQSLSGGFQYDNKHLLKEGYADVAELIAKALMTAFG